jgi:hypothetical protein
LHPGRRWKFTALFLAATIVVIAAWRGPRPLAPIMNIRWEEPAAYELLKR